MKQMGIKAQWIRPWTVTTKDSDFSNESQNILDEQFNPERPNAVWCSDITYIWTMEGFVYLTSIMDLYSRNIIAWTLSKTLETSCVIETINKAKAKRSTELPLIIHSDRGSQYVSKEYKKATAKMNRSYSKKAFPWDNACIESFHSLIKREWLTALRSAITNIHTAWYLNTWKRFIIPNEFIVIAITCHPMILKDCINRQLRNCWQVRMRKTHFNLY